MKISDGEEQLSKGLIYGSEREIMTEIKEGSGEKASNCILVKSECFQIFNKRKGGLGVLAELSLGISCQHFITVAVIKRRSPRVGRGQLNCISTRMTNAPKQEQLQHT